MENEKQMKYEAPEVIGFEWMQSIGTSCVSNGSGDYGYCSANGLSASTGCQGNGNSAFSSCDAQGSGFASGG